MLPLKRRLEKEQNLMSVFYGKKYKEHIFKKNQYPLTLIETRY
jgi:hypothetical protein